MKPLQIVRAHSDDSGDLRHGESTQVFFATGGNFSCRSCVELRENLRTLHKDLVVEFENGSDSMLWPVEKIALEAPYGLIWRQYVRSRGLARRNGLTLS